MSDPSTQRAERFRDGQPMAGRSGWRIADHGLTINVKGEMLIQERWAHSSQTYSGQIIDS